jgi:uncharacterized protein YijF (DUF1287 family)
MLPPTRVYARTRLFDPTELSESIYRKKSTKTLCRTGAYPHDRRWQEPHPDANIDHRRVPNLGVFFRHRRETLRITSVAADYSPGDLVTWHLGGGAPHIGIVVDRRSPEGDRYLVVHNIGAGPQMEDVLCSWKITGHYRYYGPAE